MGVEDHQGTRLHAAARRCTSNYTIGINVCAECDYCVITCAFEVSCGS